jgi:hypothetical protein
MIAPAHLVTAILAFVVIALPTRDAATQESNKSFIRLPSGAEVRIQGQAATAMMQQASLEASTVNVKEMVRAPSKVRRVGLPATKEAKTLAIAIANCRSPRVV